jgi:dTDP-4-dehydrorhamnose 3,5-epimerase-like enzyme
MEKSNFIQNKSFWIPKEIWLSDLTLSDKIFFATKLYNIDNDFIIDFNKK